MNPCSAVPCTVSHPVSDQVTWTAPETLDCNVQGPYRVSGWFESNTSQLLLLDVALNSANSVRSALYGPCTLCIGVPCNNIDYYSQTRLSWPSVDCLMPIVDVTNCVSCLSSIASANPDDSLTKSSHMIIGAMQALGVWCH